MNPAITTLSSLNPLVNISIHSGNFCLITSPLSFHQSVNISLASFIAGAKDLVNARLMLFTTCHNFVRLSLNSAAIAASSAVVVPSNLASVIKSDIPVLPSCKRSTESDSPSLSANSI